MRRRYGVATWRMSLSEGFNLVVGSIGTEVGFAPRRPASSIS